MTEIELLVKPGTSQDSCVTEEECKSRIDYVIFYDSNKIEDVMLWNNQWHIIEKSIKDKSIEISYDPDPSLNFENFKTNHRFILLHATSDALKQGAELLKIEKPLKFDAEYENLKNSVGCSCCPFSDCFSVINENEIFTAPFTKYDYFKRKIYQTTSTTDVSKLFTKAERSLIIHTLLNQTEFKRISKENNDDNDYNNNKNSIGIDEMKDLNVFHNCYPLHENLNDFNSERSILKKKWANWHKIFHFQPLNLIRNYFGEKVAVYFTWLGFYTTMLLPALLIGLASFIYGLVVFKDQEPVKEICNKSSHIIFCPKCDIRCPFTKLYDSCLYSKISYVFDNNSTIFLSFGICLWSTIFISLWQRKQNSLASDWNVISCQEERMRPQYKRYKDRIGTPSVEPFIPMFRKLPRSYFSSSVAFFMIILVFSAIFGVIIYRMIIVALFYALDNNIIKNNATILTTITSAILNLIAIQILGYFYQILAHWLTKLELHRLNSQYEDSYTLKMFSFQFVNYFGSIFYIAFFKGRFSGQPGDANNLFMGKWRQDDCDPAGCFVELVIQLVIIMCGKQVINNVQELGIPWFMDYIGKKLFRMKNKNVYEIKKHDDENNDSQFKQYQIDYYLNDFPDSLFDEYLEMVLQFGFVTMFVAAFPLAPLFAFINNLFEIRIDAIKCIKFRKRPVANRVTNIGIWLKILKYLSFISVLTNACIIAFTSDLVPRLVYNRYSINSNNNTTNTWSKLHLLESRKGGFIDFQLSYFNVSDYQKGKTGPDLSNWKIDDEAAKNITLCRYSGYYGYNPQYNYGSELRYPPKEIHWKILLVRIAVVVVFEHAVFIVIWIIYNLISDVPRHIKRKIVLQKYFFDKLKNEYDN